MTEGSIAGHLIKFALPLFLGNVFQQLYNTADAFIVGNWRGSEALAAVSSSGSLIFLLIGFFNGIAIGAGVVISRFYGASDNQKLHKAIHTAVAFGLICALLMTAIGVFLTPTFLMWMGTPDDVLPDSVIYFRVYFAGSLGMVMYNIFMGIHNAVGDSRHPLMYLILSSCINIVLDLLFVAVLGMGVGAAAFATIMSQLISAILSMRHLMKSDAAYKFEIRELCLDREMLRNIIRNGLPTGIQNSIISVGNVVVQSHINAFGAAAMAGVGAYQKIEGFGFLPITAFSMALTTFVSQNIGAGKYDRVKKGAVFGIISGAALAEIIGAALYIFGPTLIGLFDSSASSIEYGTQYMRVPTLFYFLLATSHCCAAVLRGSDHAVVPMVVMAADWCAFRILYVSLATSLFPQLSTVATAYPVTWTISSVIFIIYLIRRLR